MDGIIAIAFILGLLGFLSLLAVDYKTRFPKTHTVYKKFTFIVKCIMAVLVFLSLLFSPVVIGIMFGWIAGIVSFFVVGKIIQLLFDDFELDQLKQ